MRNLLFKSLNEKYIEKYRPGLLFIERQTAASSATIDFDLPTGYSNFLVLFGDITPATNGATLWLRYSTDGGSTFKDGAADYWDSVTIGTTTKIVLASSINNTTDVVLGEVNLFGMEETGTTRHECKYDIVQNTTSGAMTALVGRGVSRANMAAAVNAIRFLFDSGNIATGTFSLYAYE